MTTLGPALAKLEQLLIAAQGDFVAGQALARAAGVPMIALSSFVGQLRAKRPQIVIEGKRGKGYRLADTSTVTPAVLAKPVAPSANQRTAITASLLDLLRPASAELVKTIALDSGEAPDACVERLIAYGAEVHHSLVAEGENPVGLTAIKENEAVTRH